MSEPQPQLPQAANLSPTAIPEYRLFIDETGHPEDRSSRYMGLLGVWMSGSAHQRLTDAFQRLKDEIFGPKPTDRPVIFHRSEIINKTGYFYVLQDEEKCRQFDEGLLSAISHSNFTMMLTVMDKSRYEVSASLYHYCVTLILERYAGHLNVLRVLGDVMAEARGATEDRQLMADYESLYRGGTRFHDAEWFQRRLTSKEIKMRPKTANVAGLQLADLLAHPLKQEYLAERGLIPPIGNVFGREVCRVVRPKYNTRILNGQLEGYGRKLV